MDIGSAPGWPMLARDEQFRAALATLDRRAEFHGVALVGDSGVGKSALARAVADAVAADGRPVRFALGTQTGRDVPLGAFSRAVTVDTAHEPAAMLAAAYRTLATEADLVVVVDDAQLLDPLSAMLIQQLAMEGGARLVVTIGSGEPVPDPVTALCKERLLLTVHVDPLNREQTGRLTRGVLGGTVEPRVIDLLHARSAGNLLLLRGLLRAGRESGVLVDTEDGWQLTGDLRADRELSDLLELRLNSLSPAELDAVEVLAAAELLDWQVLRELCDTDALSRLEHRGLVELLADGSDRVARLNHPVIGEVALRRAGVVRSRQLNGLLAQALGEHLRAGGRRVRLPDARGRIQLAQFIMRSDLEPDLEVIIAAAASAMNMLNLGHAEELARFAADRGGGLAAALVLADALSWQGRSGEVESLLADVDLDGADELSTVRWGCLQAGNLFWNVRRVELARQVLADIDDRVATEEGHALVKAMDVALAFFAGDLVPALEAGPGLCVSEAVPLAAAWAAAPTSFALALVGRFDDAHRMAAVGSRADTHGDCGPLRFAIGMADVLALTGAGDHRGAERAAERYATTAAGAPEACAMVHAIRGLVHSVRGDVSSACAELRDSVSALPQGFPSSWMTLVTAWLVQAEGARGNAGAAAAALARCEAAYGPQAAVFLPELELARAWERAAAGEVSAGRTHAVGAAQIAHRSGMWAVEMRALHIAVRLGDRAHAARLADLAKVLNTPMAWAIAAHARGLAGHDGELLDAAADQFVSLGARAPAADAAAQAAREHARVDHRGKQLASSIRAHWLAGRGDIRTPAVSAATQPLPITDREREIATLAATGLSNRQIADRLSISVRTVDGHLYRIYGKLGIERRDQLVDLLSDLPSGA